MLRTMSTSFFAIALLSAFTPVQAASNSDAASAATQVGSGEETLETAWQKYYVAIKKTHDDILQSEQYKLSAQQRGMAYYSLLEAQALTYNFAMAPQLASPRIYKATSWQTELYTLGGNSADFQYGTVFLDGKLTYKLKGNMNDSKVLLADWAGSLPGSKAYTPPKSYDFSRFQIAKDGSFEVTLSATEAKGNWIKLDPEAKYQWILFRPMTGKWTGKPAQMQIERTSPVDLNTYRQQETTSAAVAERLTFAANFLTFLVDQWNIDYYPRMRSNAGGVDNRFNTLSLQTSGDVGSPSAQYMQGVFVVGKDEALVLEMDAPGGAFWTVQLFDAWLKSIDFRTRQSSLNMDQAVRDPDGKYRFVISARDPGYANWLDTGGLDRGMMLVRNYVTPQQAPAPAVHRIKFDALGEYMKGSTKITPTQRQEELRQREMAHINRIGE